MVNAKKTTSKKVFLERTKKLLCDNKLSPIGDIYIAHMEIEPILNNNTSSQEPILSTVVYELSRSDLINTLFVGDSLFISILFESNKINQVVPLLSDITQLALETNKTDKSKFLINVGLSHHNGDDPYDDTTTIGTNIIRQASKAQKIAKTKGHWIGEVNEIHQYHDPKKLTISRDLELAINENKISLLYQPKINPKTDEVAGVEVLCRWKLDDGRFMRPDLFINAAEKDEVIDYLSEYVIRNSIKDIATSISDISLSINISPVSMTYERWRNLQSCIEKSCLEYDFPISNIEIEITENMLLDKKDNIVDIINTIKAKGIKISIDDFGVGHSSISRIVSINPDVVKIDKTFTDKIEIKSGEALINNMINISKAIGAKTVVEGVERIEQKEILMSMECDLIQGYFYSKPIPINDLTDMVKKHQIKN